MRAQTECEISGQLLELLMTIFLSFKIIDEEDNEHVHDLIKY